MFTLLWKYIISLFTADKIGIIIRLMLTKAGSIALREIFDAENQKKAYELVKRLNSDDTLTGKEKAKLFNLQMAEYLKKLGKEIAESSLNCLREMALSALRAEKQ